MDILHAKVLTALSLYDPIPGTQVRAGFLPVGVQQTADGYDLDEAFLFDPLVETGYLQRRYFIGNMDDEGMRSFGPEIPPSEVHRTEAVEVGYFATDKIPRFAVVSGSKIIPAGLWLSL